VLLRMSSAQASFTSSLAGFLCGETP